MSLAAPRRGIVQLVQAPRGAFRKIVLAPGQALELGRDERAEVRIEDPSLRGAHLRLEFDAVGLHLRELGGTGSLSIDGERRSFGEVHSGGWFSAGRSTFRFFLERRSPPVEPRAPAAGAAEALAALRPLAALGKLWGVFDAARAPRILQLCEEAVDPHESLYLGTAGRELDEVAPYLVRFDPRSGLLDRLALEGWGEAWGIYASAELSPKDVRRHFRRFLVTEEETTRERLYFRWYDPRVWRAFWPVATPRQRAELVGGLSAVYAEGERGELLECAGVPGALPEGAPSVAAAPDDGADAQGAMLAPGGDDVPDP